LELQLDLEHRPDSLIISSQSDLRALSVGLRCDTITEQSEVALSGIMPELAQILLKLIMHLSRLLTFSLSQFDEQGCFLWHFKWDVLFSWRSLFLILARQFGLSLDNFRQHASTLGINDEAALFTAKNTAQNAIALIIRYKRIN